MTTTIEAQYFNGQSAVSQQVTIEFDDSMTDFHFQTADGFWVVWQFVDLQFEQYGYLIEIRNKNYSGAILKIEDKAFSQNFYEVMKLNKRVDIHTRLLKLGFYKISIIAIILLGLIILSYFYVLPSIAEKSAALLPESFDNEIGNVFMQSFLNENKIDTAKTKYLELFSSELNFHNKKPLHFTVVKSKEVNAFALPNGHIVVYTAILDKLKNYNELAALLGHEASHVNSRHSTKMLCRNLAGYVTVSLLFSDVNGVMAVLADNAQQLHTLSYSRKFEQEADEQGLQILIDNHIDPNGMVQLFEQLERVSRFSIPQIISSHPLTKERKKNMNSIISKTIHAVKPHNKLNSIFQYIKN